jgi:hypothetical protein
MLQAGLRRRTRFLWQLDFEPAHPSGCEWGMDPTPLLVAFVPLFFLNYVLDMGFALWS